MRECKHRMTFGNTQGRTTCLMCKAELKISNGTAEVVDKPAPDFHDALVARLQDKLVDAVR